MNSCIVSIENLNFSFDSNTILKNFSLKIYEGDRIGICGINGSGKSTLLRLLSGIYFSNNIIFNKNISTCSILNPNSGLNLHLTVFENIKRVAFLMNIDLKLNQRFYDYLNLLDLNKHLKIKTFKLSQGYKIRIFLLVFFIYKFDFIIIDEYISFGDTFLREKLKKDFDERLKSSTLVMASHDESFLKKYANSIIYL